MSKGDWRIDPGIDSWIDERSVVEDIDPLDEALHVRPELAASAVARPARPHVGSRDRRAVGKTSVLAQGDVPDTDVSRRPARMQPGRDAHAPCSRRGRASRRAGRKSSRSLSFDGWGALAGSMRSVRPMVAIGSPGAAITAQSPAPNSRPGVAAAGGTGGSGVTVDVLGASGRSLCGAGTTGGVRALHAEVIACKQTMNPNAAHPRAINLTSCDHDKPGSCTRMIAAACKPVQQKRARLNYFARADPNVATRSGASLPDEDDDLLSGVLAVTAVRGDLVRRGPHRRHAAATQRGSRGHLTDGWFNPGLVGTADGVADLRGS